ncbi:MAG: glycosyltransferase [Verrucomicrobiota bacterium]
MNPRTGGPCEGVRNLATFVSQQGDGEMEVVCLNDPNSDYLSNCAFPLYAVGESRTPWGYHPALRPWLEKHLPSFDAIILNGLWQYHGYIVSKLSRHPGSPPYFLFPHGMLDPWFQRTAGRGLKAIRNWSYWKLVEQYVIRNSEAVLFTSTEEMRLARDTFRPYRPKNQTSVGYGIFPPPQFHPGMSEAFQQKCPGIKGRPYFLFLGRIHPKKGIHLLIQGYAALCRAIAGSAMAQLVIAGPDSETPYGRKMQALASEICPRDSVFWPGMLTGEAKWGAFYNCQASVLPSNQENFGIAVVETLACGRPVLISDQVNIWLEIKEAGAGLVENNSVAGTTRLFLNWNTLSTEAQAKMAAQAKPCFERHFSIESTHRNLMAVLASGVRVAGASAQNLGLPVNGSTAPH